MRKLDAPDEIRNFHQIVPDGFVLICRGGDHKNTIHKASCSGLQGPALNFWFYGETVKYEGYTKSRGINLMNERQSIKLCKTCKPNIE